MVCYGGAQFTFKSFCEKQPYSHLSNNRGGWNKRGGSAKVAKLINVEVEINVEWRVEKI